MNANQDEISSQVLIHELRRQIGELLQRLIAANKSVERDGERLIWASKNPEYFAVITGKSDDIEKLRTVIDIFGMK